MPPLNPSLASQQANPMFRIAALIHGRGDVLHLEFGEPDFPTPAHIVAAAEASLRDERQGYGPGNGIPSLRAAIAARVARVNQFTPTPEQIVVTAGGTGALMTSLLCLCAPGDAVLVPDPAWAGYDAMLAVAGARKVYYPLLPDQDWQPDFAAMERLVTPRTRVLLVNSPSNPGGAVFGRAVVAHLLAFARRHDLWLLSDECYDEMLFAGEHVSPAALEAEERGDAGGRVLTIGTCSKTYAMTGWRVGWVTAPPALAPALTLAVSAQVNNLPLFIQRAAEAALTGPQDGVGAMRASYQARRDLAVEVVRARGLLEYVPAGAFYLLVHVARAAGVPAEAPFESVAFAERLIATRRIAVAPGAAFGPRTARYVRVSLASDAVTLRAGLTGLLDFAAHDPSEATRTEQAP
ncbi:MAG: aminotransferase class I/II-fold pyridoxal phosphate-dependent enzyme [Ktedonobacterales bacterium]|nr:aminotransferase class I/II-fold pyridoxal phosphate-dependent enzyme [Ktedonobacterales bacterium]